MDLLFIRGSTQGMCNVYTFFKYNYRVFFFKRFKIIIVNKNQKALLDRAGKAG